MKKHLIAAVLSLVPLLVSAGEPAKPASPYVSVQPGLEISVHPAKEPGMFEVKAKITDSVNGEMYAGAGLFVRAGEWKTQSIPAQGKRPAFDLAATVDPSGELAAYSGREYGVARPTKTYSGTVMVTK